MIIFFTLVGSISGHIHLKFQTKTHLFSTLNMSNLVPGNCDSRTALSFCFHFKNSASESHETLLEAKEEHVLGKSQCFDWFEKF